MIIVLAGGSGTGKSSLMHELERRCGAIILCSYTTRAPRTGEVDGRDYHFISREEMDSLDLFERVEYAGNIYGTPREMFDRVVASNKTAVIAMNVDGARLLKEEYGDAVALVLLTMPLPVRRALLERRDGVEAATKRLATEDPPPKPSDADWDFILPNNGHQWDEIRGIIEAAYFS